MGDGGVEVHTLPTLLAVLGHGEDVEATHNLQPISQLNEYHTRIDRVADQHIAEVVGLLLRDFEFDVRDLAQSHDNTQHGLAKLLTNLVRERLHLLGALLVGDANYIVQDGCHGRVTTKAQLARHDLCHGNVVVEHRGAIVAGIALHLLLGIEQGTIHGLLRGGRITVCNETAQRAIFM